MFLDKGNLNRLGKIKFSIKRLLLKFKACLTSFLVTLCISFSISNLGKLKILSFISIVLGVNLLSLIVFKSISKPNSFTIAISQ